MDRVDIAIALSDPSLHCAHVILYISFVRTCSQKDHYPRQNHWVPPLLRIEPSHEIMILFVHRTLILQTRMSSHPVGIDAWFFVGPFVYFHTSCVRTAKALARLRRCAGSPEPSLIAYVISTIISWAGSVYIFRCRGRRNSLLSPSSVYQPTSLH